MASPHVMKISETYSLNAIFMRCPRQKPMVTMSMVIIITAFWMDFLGVVMIHSLVFFPLIVQQWNGKSKPVHTIFAIQSKSGKEIYNEKFYLCNATRCIFDTLHSSHHTQPYARTKNRPTFYGGRSC